MQTWTQTEDISVAEPVQSCNVASSIRSPVVDKEDKAKPRLQLVFSEWQENFWLVKNIPLHKSTVSLQEHAEENPSWPRFKRKIYYWKKMAV